MNLSIVWIKKVKCYFFENSIAKNRNIMYNYKNEAMLVNLKKGGTVILWVRK